MKSVKVALLASALLASAPASAASYLFDINIGGTTGSGSFTTVGDASAGYTLINSLTGTFGGATVTLLAPGSYPVADSNDNLFREASPIFTFNGLSFSAGGTNYNIYNSQGLSACVAGRGCGVGASFSARAVAAAVPEPGTWMMMLLGFGVVGGALRSARRHRTTTVTYA